MNIFNKNFLRPIRQNLTSISQRSTLYSILIKSFARSFKIKNPEGDNDASVGISNVSETKTTKSEDHVKIPKYQRVNAAEPVNTDNFKENIILPNTSRAGAKKFEDDKFNPRARQFRGGFEDKEEGQEGGKGEFENKRPRFNRDEGDFRNKGRFGDKDGEFKPRRNFNRGENEEGGFRSRSDFQGERRFDRPPRFNRDEEGGDRPPRFNRSFDAEGGDRPPRFDKFGDRPPRQFGDRPPRQFGDRPPRFDREDKFGDRPPRFEKFGDRPPRFDREEKFGDRPPRFDREEKFGDRPPRFDREEKFGDRPPRFDREEKFGDRPPRFNREDKFGDRPPRFDKFGDRPPRFDKFGDRPPRFDREDKFGDRPPRFNREEKFGDRPPRTDRNPPKNENVPEEDFEHEINESLEEAKKINPNLNSFAKEEIVNSNRITLSELKNKKRQDKVDPEITKVNLEDVLNKTSPAATEEVEESIDERITYEFKDNKKEYLYGAHAVEAAVTFNLRKNLDLFVQMSYKENTPDHIAKIIEAAQGKNIKVKYLTKEKLDKFTGGRPHNGLVLKSEPRDYIYIKGFDAFANKFIHKTEGNLLVLLDQIVDPQNFGSVIRSAFFLGSDAIMLNKRNKPPISSTVCKVSSGASECTDLFAVKSLRRFLSEAIEKGWTVVTTSIEKEHDVQLRLNTTEEKDEEANNGEESSKTSPKVEAKNIALTELNLPKSSNVIVVLGSEANGITSDLTGAANYNVYIPPLLNKELTGKHPYDIIDSLNVGVSAGIIINHIKSQLKRPSKDEQDLNANKMI